MWRMCWRLCGLPILMHKWSKTLKSAKLNHRLPAGTTEGNSMSAPAPHTPDHEVDIVEAVVPYMPIVLPVAGGVLMFLLAFIAVFMA